MNSILPKFIIMWVFSLKKDAQFCDIVAETGILTGVIRAR